MSEILTGTVLDFPYTGAVEEITLPKGTYKLECWGAQGGDAHATYAHGGLGGYASGILRLNLESKVFVRSGQAGINPTAATAPSAAFNGGGVGNLPTSASSSFRISGGGGASDVRIGQDSLYARVIVAGAGGGSGYTNFVSHQDGGYGGGESGGSGETNSSGAREGYGGTQTAGGGNGYKTSANYGSFGQGGNDATPADAGAGGGGGWYGGGAADGNYCGGGGGSGFVWTGLNAPDGYLLTEEHYLTETQNIAGNTSFSAPDGTAETGHSGDGYVRITVLEIVLDPKTPENFRIESETEDGIALAWDAAENATGYQLTLNGSAFTDTVETSAFVPVEIFSSVTLKLISYNDVGKSDPAILSYQKFPDDPVLYLITDRTAQDVNARNSKGSYSAIDLNRVGYAVRYLADKLEAVGVHVDVEPVYTWTDTEWATPSAMEPYLEQVRIMRNALTLAYAPAVPDDMQQLTFSEANDIESVLLALDSHIKAMVSSVDAGWATGTAYTGFYAKEAY